MINIFLFVILGCLPLMAQEPPQEIRIHLSTANPLQSIFIGKIGASSSPFTAVYLSELEAILRYDFQYNGSTQVCDKPGGAPYLLSLTLQESGLQASVSDVSNHSLKNFPTIPLTGDLKEDRQKLHKLADAIYKTLFHAEGIASSRILFAYQNKTPRSDGSGWASEIWECDWDGANARQITHEGSYCVTPVLLPSSSQFGNDKFLYVSYKLGQPKIYIASLREGTGKRLIDLRGNQLLPAISSKRDKIAFISDAGGRTDLFLQPLNPKTGDVGKPIQLYSFPRSTQASPTFSPDGSKLAFVSDKDGGMRIYVLPTLSSEKRGQAQMISKQNRENSCPCWSPDGKKLAYSAKTSGIRQIWIYDFATQEEMQLTSGPGNKENPYWAPDSQHLVFNSTDATSSELYIVNLNQTEALRITKGPGKKHYPTWGPRT